MSTIINTRSPYYLKFAKTGAASVSVNIKIYSGDKAPLPSEISYTLVKNTDIPSGAPYEQGVFEVSELIRDYIYTDYYTEAIDAVWVYVQWTFYDGPDGTGSALSGGGDAYYLAVDGFGYFEEGINPRKSIDPTADSYTPMLLQDNLTIYFVPGEQITIPFFGETEPCIDWDFSVGGPEWQTLDEYWQTYDGLWNSTLDDTCLVDSDNSLEKIHYVGLFPTTGIRSGDTGVITSSVGPAQTQTITFQALCAGKYPDVKIVFYNKYGAIQELWAHKKSIKSLNTKAETYNRNIMDYGSLDYSVYKHATSRFDVNGRESITVNTDLLDESINEPVKQLLLSEQVWLEIGNDTYPVVVKSSSVTEKTSVNDKMVQYTFEFEYAYDKVQNIR